MSANKTFGIGPGFDLDLFARRLADTYAAKGYSVNATKVGSAYTITFEKGLGGINTITGLGEGVTATITQTGDSVSVNFTDEEWTSKIIAAVVGWFLCWVPLITAVIGFVRQTDLPKNIAKDAGLIIASFN